MNENYEKDKALYSHLSHEARPWFTVPPSWKDWRHLDEMVQIGCCKEATDNAYFEFHFDMFGAKGWQLVFDGDGSYYGIDIAFCPHCGGKLPDEGQLTKWLDQAKDALCNSIK